MARDARGKHHEPWSVERLIVRAKRNGRDRLCISLRALASATPDQFRELFPGAWVVSDTTAAEPPQPRK